MVSQWSTFLDQPPLHKLQSHNLGLDKYHWNKLYNDLLWWDSNSKQFWVRFSISQELLCISYWYAWNKTLFNLCIQSDWTQHHKLGCNQPFSLLLLSNSFCSHYLQCKLMIQYCRFSFLFKHSSPFLMKLMPFKLAQWRLFTWFSFLNQKTYFLLIGWLCS